ncbi:MAG: cytochrome P450, partial [Tsuneonella sp.]
MAEVASSSPQANTTLFDPAVQQCPYAAYQALRDEAPAYNIPGTDIFVVTRYEDVRRVLTDPVTFPSSAREGQYRSGAATDERGRKII